MDSDNRRDKQPEPDRSDAWALLDVFTRQRSMELVDRAMDDDRDEPENFIRMLLLLHDHSDEAALQAALMNLIRAAYNLSIAHGHALDRYLDGLRGKAYAADMTCDEDMPEDLREHIGKKRSRLSRLDTGGESR